MVINKRIALIGPAYPYRGGISQFSNHLVHYLNMEKNIIVNIYNYSLQFPSPFFPGKTQYDKSESFYDFASERILNPINPFTWRTTAKQIIGIGYQIAIIQWWHPFFGPALYTISKALRRKNIKVIFITHNYSSHELGGLLKFITKPVLKQADLIVTLSEYVNSQIKRELPTNRVIKIKTPVFSILTKGTINRETARIELGFKKDEMVALFFGHVRPYKGLKDLIEALPIVIEKLTEIKLLIAGEFYEKLKHYQILIKKNNIEKNVIIENKYIPNEDVFKYFQASDVLILPYRSASQSGIIPQAHQFNLPVITTDVGGLADDIDREAGDNIVPVSDKDALAKAIVDFFQKKHVKTLSSDDKPTARDTWAPIIDIIKSE